MTKEDRKRMNKIVCKLIVGNMENGSTYKQAKKQAFNRLNKDFPEMLRIWINR